MNLQPVVCACAVAALAACSGGGSSVEDVAGIYEVSYHTLNEDDCLAEGPANTDYSHFQLLLGDFLGQEYVSFGECSSAAMADCDDGGLFSAFIDMGGSLVSELSASSGGGAGTCFLSYARSVLTDAGDGTVRIERHAYNEEDDTLSEEACDPDTASARGTAMPCTRFEILEGRRAP